MPGCGRTTSLLWFMKSTSLVLVPRRTQEHRSICRLVYDLTPSLEALSLSVLLSSASFSGDPELGKGHESHLNPDVPALLLFILGSRELGPRNAHGSGNNRKT